LTTQTIVQAYIFRDLELKEDISDGSSETSKFFRVLALCHTVLVDQNQRKQEQNEGTYHCQSNKAVRTADACSYDRR